MKMVLAFDFGKQRIGVAQGQTLTATASPLITLHCPNNKPDWAAIDHLIREWLPQQLIVGLPERQDGSHSKSTKAAEAFAKTLAEHSQLPVELHNETLSSHAAEEILREQRQNGTRFKRVQKGDIDQIAAAIILQSWLNENSNN